MPWWSTLWGVSKRVPSLSDEKGGFSPQVPVYEGFGAGGLAFQLSGGGTDDASDDDIDHDLITVS